MPKVGEVRRGDAPMELTVPNAYTDDPKPYWQTTDGETVRLYLGDVVARLKQLPAGSVHCVVTSPPYWGLRSYLASDHEDKNTEIGSEATTDEFVAKMVEVFSEVKRVLRNDGICWLNLGDTYANTWACSPASPVGNREYRETDRTRQEDMKRTKETYGSIKQGNLVGIPWRVALALQADGWILRQDIVWQKPSPMPESVRNRCTKAHEYIFLLTKRMGYYYDAEAIKEKSAGGNLFNKPTGAYPGRNDGNSLGVAIQIANSNKRSVWSIDDEAALLQWLSERDPFLVEVFLRESKNKPDVWRVSSQGYDGAHFATFSPKLIEPCILAGTSAYGACAQCGTPWKRVVEQTKLTRERPRDYVKRTGEEGTGNSCANSVAGVDVKTIGWQPGCECNGKFEKQTVKVVGQMPCDEYAGDDPAALRLSNNDADGRRQLSGKAQAEWKAKEHTEEELTAKTVLGYVSDLPLEDHPIMPCTVLDPFMGSGTTAVVCIDNGLRCWGIDLSAKYLKNNAIPRIEGALLSRPALAHLAGRVAKKVTLGVQANQS